MGLTMSQDGVANFLDDLLLQRAVQTQLFYFQEFRDGFKRQWLENFLDHEGLMNYHGFGGLKVSADEYLTSMFNSAPVEHEVKMSWGSRLAGGSKDNPYLQQQPTYNYYMETVHPQKICKGVMEIREQLKLEWITDLPVMREEDDLFKDAFQRLKEAQEDAMMNLDSSRSTRTLSRRPGSKEKMDKQKQDEEKYGKWDWDSYDAVGGGDDVGDVPAGLEEVARMQRAQEATGGMIQFDGPDQEEAAGLSLVVFFFGLDVRSITALAFYFARTGKLVHQLSHARAHAHAHIHPSPHAHAHATTARAPHLHRQSPKILAPFALLRSFPPSLPLCLPPSLPLCLSVFLSRSPAPIPPARSSPRSGTT